MPERGLSRDVGGRADRCQMQGTTPGARKAGNAEAKGYSGMKADELRSLVAKLGLTANSLVRPAVASSQLLNTFTPNRQHAL